MSNEAIKARAYMFAKYGAALFRRSGMTARLAQGVRGSRYVSLGYRLGDSLQVTKALKLADPLATATAVSNVAAYAKMGLVWFDFELRRSHWQTFTRADVDGLGIGLGARGQQIEYPLLTGGYHGLFAGGTKAGKSTAIQSLLCGLAATYSPDDVDLFIVDPHGDYEAFQRLPHLAAPVATGFRAIQDTITAVKNLYVQRKAENDRAAKRTILIADEAQDADFIGSKDGGFNKDILGHVADLARGAGKYRVHLVIGSQRPTQKDMPAIIDNIHNRFVGKVDNAATGAALSGHAQTPAHKLSGYGDFLAIGADGFTRFQVAMPTAADYERLPRAEGVPELEAVQPLDDRFEDVEETAVAVPDTGGRPTNGIEIDKLGWLMVNDDVSDYSAAKNLGLTRYMVQRYRQEADRLIAILCKGGFRLAQQCE